MITEKKKKTIINKIIKDCDSCGGLGCNLCKGKASRIELYSRANIPVDYWFLSLKNFEGDQNFKNLVSDIFKNIDKVYEDGISYAFIGNLGTGKTYAATALLKKAVVIGYSSLYIHMADIIQSSTEGNYDIFKKIIDTDFVCLDEYCDRWVYPSDKAEQLFGQTMERILRHRFQNKMPTIICSNTPELKDVLAGDFSKATDSLFSRYVKNIYVSGKDYRKLGV